MRKPVIASAKLYSQRQTAKMLGIRAERLKGAIDALKIVTVAHPSKVGKFLGRKQVEKIAATLNKSVSFDAEAK
jgi:hypothetical protein